VEYITLLQEKMSVIQYTTIKPSKCKPPADIRSLSLCLLKMVSSLWLEHFHMFPTQQWDMELIKQHWKYQQEALPVYFHVYRITTGMDMQSQPSGFPLLLQKNPGLFQDPQNIFPGCCRSTAIFKCKDKWQLLTQNIQCGSTINRCIAEHSSQIEKKVQSVRFAI